MEKASSDDDQDHRRTEEKIDGDEVEAVNNVNHPTRSYECNFCKRGFSNAQALGGHMNLHRKDKAKIKEQQQQQYQATHNKELWNVPHQQAVMEDETNNNVVMMRQLPLFAESSPHHHHQQQQQEDQISGDQGRRPSSSSELLDLELRLGGPEPPQGSSSSSPSSSATMGTRKFF